MIIVAGEIVVDPSAIPQVRDALAKMEQETRNEAGCITYAFSQDICAPEMVRIFERWNSMADIELHMKTPHMAEFMGSVVALAPKSMEIKAYDGATEVALPG
jgi:quinol monooxygenase YgiN